MLKRMAIVLFLMSALLMAAKFTDDTFELGGPGVTSKILFSGGDGVLQYNVANSRWEFADDGVAFNEFGSVVTSDEFTIYHAVFEEDRGLTTSDVVSNANPPTLGPQSPAGWVTSIERRLHPSTRNPIRGSNAATFKADLFTAPPFCWASSEAAYLPLSAVTATGIGMVNRRNAISGLLVTGPVNLWCVRGNE